MPICFRMPYEFPVCCFTFLQIYGNTYISPSKEHGKVDFSPRTFYPEMEGSRPRDEGKNIAGTRCGGFLDCDNKT
jgi:hypothetical protein